MRLLLFVLTLLPLPALAGPWPQEKGNLYVLVSHQNGDDPWTGVYAEYGGPFGLTFGLDAGGHVAGLPQFVQTGIPDQDIDGRLRSFVRIPLPLPKSGDGDAWHDPWLAAVELSVGRDFDDFDPPVNRAGVGVTVGRGFSTPCGDGWTTLGASVAVPVLNDFSARPGFDPDNRYTAGIVLGLKPVRRLAVELAAFVEVEGETSYQVGPTVQYSLGRIVDLRLGAAYRDDGRTVVTFGLSRAF